MKPSHNMPKVQPINEHAANALLLDHLEEWRLPAINDIQSIATTGHPVMRYKHGEKIRCFQKTVCIPIGCSPCYLWSCMVRLVCCPISCGKSIGGNELTASSDECITQCCRAVDEMYAPKQLVPHDLTGVSSNDEAKKSLHVLMEIFYFKLSNSYFKNRMIDWLDVQFKLLGFQSDFSKATPATIKQEVEKFIGPDGNTDARESNKSKPL